MGNAGGLSAGVSSTADSSTRHESHGDDNSHRASNHRQLSSGELQEIARNLDGGSDRTGVWIVAS